MSYKTLGLFALLAFASPAMAETLYTQDRYNFRSGPGINHSVEEVFDAGSEFTVLAREGRWVNVKNVKTGEEGWIHRRGLGPSNPAVTNPEDPDCCGKRPAPTPKIGDEIMDQVGSGAFSSPVKGRACVTGGRRFACYVHPILHVPKQHHGIDIKVPSGTPLVAPSEGCRVVSRRWAGGYGYQLQLKCGSHTISYSHLSRFQSKSKINYKKGEVIGYSGKTGLATGPHLHLEVRKNGNRVNPLSIFTPAGLCKNVNAENKRSNGCGGAHPIRRKKK